MDAGHAEIEHLFKESYIRNPGYFVLQTLQCYCAGSTICSCGGSVCENEINLISCVTFIQ